MILALEVKSRKHLYNCNILFHFPNTVQTTSFLILYMVILIEYQFGPDHIQRVWNEKQILKLPKNGTFLWLDFIEHRAIHIHLQLMLGPKWNLKKKSEKGPFNDDNYWKCFDDGYFLWDFPDSRPPLVLLRAEIVK